MARRQRRPGGGSPSAGSLDKWNTRDDIPDTEQDAFHRQQDRIMLGDVDGTGNATDEDDQYGALSFGRGVLDVDVEESESEDESDEEDPEDEDSEAYEEEASKKSFKTVAKVARTDDSDDNVDDQDEDNDDDAENGADGPDDLPMGTWGSNKQSYYSTNNLDDFSSDSEMDEDEKREMEVREVKRLQAKARQGMVEEDFGLNQDSLKLDGSLQAREARRKDFEVLAKKQTKTAKIDLSTITPLQRAETISRIHKTTPETLALIGEYADIVEDITVVSRRLKKVMETGGQAEMAGLCCLHHQVLLTYAANLSFYFYLRASPKYSLHPTKLAEHPVIGRLWKLKNGLSLLDNFGFTGDESEEESNADEEEESIEYDEDEENREPAMSFLFKPDAFSDDEEEGADDLSLGSLEEDELMQLYREGRESEEVGNMHDNVEERMELLPLQKQKPKSETKKKTTKKKGKKDMAPLANVANEMMEEDDSFASIRERKRNGAKRVIASSDAEAFNAFGEPTQLTASDSADKEAGKRSLKFYTGQIDAKEARKAGGSGLGGDTDIPYRDRDRSRMAVANANAKKAATDSIDRRLDGDDFGEEDSRDYRDVMELNRVSKRASQDKDDDDDDDDGDDYYDLVASGKRSAKRAKKDEYDDMKASQRVAPVDDLDDGEYRGINRTIEKNRGLTPHRKKENRNPRVKKRKRYEAAQKKLSSKGPVYKGGQGALQGGYTGEKTGINSNVVKSRSFA